MAKAKVVNPRIIKNNYGHIKLGHIDTNNTIGGVLIRNGAPQQESEHYMQFNYSGPLKGGTLNRCPGVYQIICGDKPVNDVGFVLRSNTGDILIQAPSGRIRMEAKYIDIVASSHLNIDAGQKVTIRSKNIEINGSSVAKFFSSGLCEIVGKNALNFSGGLIDCADGATSVKKSKLTSKLETQEAKDSIL